MNEASEISRRVAARDALAARTRTLTAGVLGISAVLSGLFAGIAAASAPGHKLLSGTSARRRQATSMRRSSAIPALPAAPGAGNLSAAPPAPTPAPAPAPTQSPPAVVSGGS
jgi:hypothetical protein